MDSSVAAPTLTFRPVDRQTWPDMERLFEAPGGPKFCWCMAWRATPKEAGQTAGPKRKAMLKRRVMRGTPVGLLGYERDRPVAWCSIAPRDTYRPLGGPEARARERIWSVVCFFVVRRLRGAGLARQLLDAAIRQARAHGATVIEAYPVDPGSPSYRFMGFVPMFKAAGFKPVGRAGTRRHVMRRRVRPLRRANPVPG